MFIHVGLDCVVETGEIIGIFDFESATVSKRTNAFLKQSEQKGEVISAVMPYEIPKSFILCAGKSGKNRLYISQLSSQTLKKRMYSLYEKEHEPKEKGKRTK